MSRMFAQSQIKLLLGDGQEKEMPVTIIEDVQHDGWFEKLYLQAFISSIEDISNSKLKIALFLMEIKDKTGKIILTQDQISQATGISRKTVNTTMQLLIKSKFLVKAGKVFQINPYVMYHGRSRNILLRDLDSPEDAIIYQQPSASKPSKTEVKVIQGTLPLSDDAKAV